MGGESEGKARGIGPGYSADNALKVTYDNVRGGANNCPPPAGFCPCLKNSPLE